MDHWKKCHQFILICGSTPSNQCQPSPPAWLRSDAVKSAIENDLRQHKKSLAKQRDTMQVLVDSQNIQDGYRVRVFSDCCSILLGKCHLRIFNSKLYFDFLCRITQIDPFFFHTLHFPGNRLDGCGEQSQQNVGRVQRFLDSKQSQVIVFILSLWA